MTTKEKVNILAPERPAGWVSAIPLENYSSLHELSVLDMVGLHLPWPKKHLFVELSCNMHTPLVIHPNAYLTFHAIDDNLPPAFPTSRCYTISNFNRWRLEVSDYQTMEDFLSQTIRWHRCNHKKSAKMFADYGCCISLIEGDWSQHAERVYHLYANVAARHGDWLYDLGFFQKVAKRPDYSLLAAWHEEEMIAVFVLQEEPPTLHSICCGMDYHHSKGSYAYSWMHYALIEKAIEMNKYKNVDVGLTADQSKETIGFKPIVSRMDIYSKGLITRGLLRLISRFVKTTITPSSTLKFENG